MSSKWNKRFWLNKGTGETAFIAPSVEFAKDDSWVTADIKIADCNRMITLDFGGNGNKSQEQALHKLLVLQQTLQEFREKLIAAYEKIKK